MAQYSQLESELEGKDRNLTFPLQCLLPENLGK